MAETDLKTDSTQTEDTKLYVNKDTSTSVSSWVDFTNPSYLKGFAVAAGVTLVATNPKVRETLINGGVKVWEYFQGGVEELKEKVQDVRAEMSEKSNTDTEE